MSALSIQQVSRTFENPRGGSTQALLPVDFEVRDNDFVTILGPSGCGKSTLLRIVAGLDTPSGGRVLLDGQPVAGPGADRGMVFQSYTLFPWLTIEQNVRFGLRERGMSDAAQKERSDFFMARVGLRGFEHHFPKQLSGGMQQRTAIARALANDPKILLLDEPFGALDAKVRKELRQWLRSLHSEIHVTSIFVTHDQEEALEVANRVVVMDKGRIEQIGSPGEVYDNPATAFVHGFIGESIVLPVDVAGDAVRLDGRPLNIPALGAASGAAKLFVRRHDMAVGPAGTGALEGAIRHVRSFGPIQRAEVALAGSEGKTVIEIDAPRDRELQAGEIVSLQPRRYRIFAAQ